MVKIVIVPACLVIFSLIIKTFIGIDTEIITPDNLEIITNSSSILADGVGLGNSGGDITQARLAVASNALVEGGFVSNGVPNIFNPPENAGDLSVSQEATNNQITDNTEVNKRNLEGQVIIDKLNKTF